MILPGASVSNGSVVWLSVACAATVLGTVLYWKAKTAQLAERIEDLTSALQLERDKRQAERQGRIRAERKLATKNVSRGDGDDAGSSSATSNVQWGGRMTIISYAESVFSQRNGTPRQPNLVTSARARVKLLPAVPISCFDGLEQFSHCWLVYIFHQNTDIHQGGHGPHEKGVKGKIKPPRLNGASIGVLATRSPHRPTPIGLSLCKIIAVSGDTLVVGGADIVTGTPILDVKPYIPYSDCVVDARAPAWVTETGSDGMTVASVSFAPTFEADMQRCWSLLSKGRQSLVGTCDDMLQLAKEVLSRDMRSLHKRQQDVGMAAKASSSAHDASSLEPYHVVLLGIDILYNITATKAVVAASATLNDCPAESEKR